MRLLGRFVLGLKLDTRTAILLTTAACGVGALVVMYSGHRAAKAKIQRARDRRTESLKRAEQVVLEYKHTHPFIDSTRILSLSLAELTKQLQEELLNPADVFYSYMEKTLEVHKKLNCCTEILLESFDDVKTLEANKDGLLYGIPVSIKENLAYKNHDCSCGVVVNLEHPVQMDSVIVEVLKKQGAIPFVKTNLPQALLNFDCSNPIYGQTLNPLNQQKSPGGSSGGEAALIAGGGSLLGIGTDIGGSIRIPSSFCGICGFKPTGGRLSSKGQVPIFRGQKSVVSSAGPMARDVDSLALCMQALLCDHMFTLDPTVPPVPFNKQVYQGSKPLRIGYFENDGYTQPTPSMARAVREVKNLLEKEGHTLVPYRPLRLYETINRLIASGVLADGAHSMLQKLKDGPIDPCLAPQIALYCLPKWLKRMLALVIKPLSPRIADSLIALCGLRSVADLWKQHADVENYISETIGDWRKCNIDVLLCPALGPAFTSLYPGKLTSCTSYTALYNLLNFPAGTVTVSKVTAEDEEELKQSRGIYYDFWEKLLKRAVTGGEGLPVSVQCVALPWQDELCLRFMKEVEDLVKQNVQ